MFHDPLAVKSAIIHEFPKLKVLVVGDLMIDRYVWGSVSRVSPEAPVPIVRLERRSETLGGAANVANNLVHLGVKVDLAGYVGHDRDAAVAHELCASKGVGSKAVVSINDFCTITKTRVFGEHQQLLRIDEETTDARGEEDEAILLQAIRELFIENPYNAVILSDYAKGVCGPSFCQALMKLAKQNDIPVFVDPKGVDYDKYAGATAIKPNKSEMTDIARKLGWPLNDLYESARLLQKRLDLEFVALTLGANGIALLQGDQLNHVPAKAREVYDVSGAGDTVIATLVSAYASKLTLLDSLALCNLAAAQVVAKLGSTPVERDELLLAVQSENRAEGLRKLFATDDILRLVEAWRTKGYKIGLTNGCFDLLHAGHVRLLEDSANAADKLIVAINSDDSIQRLKGNGRPLMPENQRVQVLSALECVDAIVVYGEDTPLELLDAIRPDILIKGNDYTADKVVGADFVESYGGVVKLIPLMEGISTTKLAAAINSL